MNVVIQERGGLYVARYAGKPNAVFGATPGEARHRLEDSDWCQTSVDGRKHAPIVTIFRGITESGPLFKKLTQHPLGRAA